MTRAREAREVEIAYRDQLGWGEINAHTIQIDGESGRRLDIVDIGNRRGVEVKSGYATATEENLSELARDKSLLGDWDIAWRFEGRVSAPLLRALDEAGIPWSISDPANLPPGYR